MKNVKRFLCIIMSVIILVSAPITSYMEARAVEVIMLPFLEDLLVSLGISFGLGAQNEFSSQLYNSGFKDYLDAAASGGTFTLPQLGTVDFSDSNSVKSMLDRSMRVNMSLLTGDPSHMQDPFLESMDNAYADAALKLDLVSYHNTGTCATNAMDESISACYDDYNGSSEALAEDIQSCFTVINGGGNFNDDDDDDEEKIAHRKKFWKIFSAITAAGMIGFGNASLPLAALKEYSDSEFSEYDAVFGDAYFDGNYKTNDAGQYVYSISGDGDTYRFVFDKVVSSYKIVGVTDQNMVTFYRLVYEGSSPVLDIVSLRISKQIDITSGRVYENGKSYPYCYSGNFTGNIPLYSTQRAALNALVSGSFSDAENIQSSYADFKSNIEGAGAVVGSAFSNYIGSLRSLSDISNVVGDISDASNTYGGTAEALEEVADILNKAAGLIVTNPDPDDPSSSSGNYSGILGKILTAINNLPVNILNKFVSKFMTADSLTKLINSLPSLFVDAFKGMLELVLSPVIAAINFLPEGVQARLIELFPNSVAIGNAIIGFPDAVAQAVKGIVVNVPEIKIPEIEIPEIKIPEISIPDVFVEVNPNITLDPSYNITVQNDYTGLSGIIFEAVEGVMIALFVPEEAPFYEKLDEMKEYFKFKDDITKAIDDLKTMFFGITPSPILKIPIGKTTSKKYNYGTGDYIIIDVSWYAPYKQFGDKVILAIVWALFIWRLFLKLPGIISGAEGSIMAADKSYQKYTSGKE